jgi:hypothetical protein
LEKRHYLFPSGDQLSQIETLRASSVVADEQFLSSGFSVSKLVCSNVRVRNLEWAPNLTSLHLLENSSIDIDCLPSLASLREFRLGINFSIDDDSLTNLRELSCLRLDDNPKITSRSVSVLTNLTELGLQGRCRVTDDGISGLSQLTKLDLYQNSLITYEGKPVMLLLNKEGISALTNLIHIIGPSPTALPEEKRHLLPNLVFFSFLPSEEDDLFCC